MSISSTAKFLLALACLTPVIALSSDISKLDPDDVVYKAGWTGILNPSEVLVVRVDLSDGKVKVRDVETGLTEWVDPSDLYTTDELSAARINAAVKVAEGASQGIENADVKPLTAACANDNGMALVFALGATFKNENKLLPEDACKCFATNIYRGETQETTAQLIEHFEMIDSILGKEKFEKYLAPCVSQ